jgi:hypothetical protein
MPTKAKEAHGPKSLSGPSNRQTWYPSGEPLSLSRGRHRTATPPPPPPPRGSGAPSMRLHLDRGPWPRGQVPASLEGPSPSSKPPPHSRPPMARARPTFSPDRGNKCSGTPWVPGSKANPRRANLLTQPGNQIPALCNQPAAMQPSLALY